MPYPPSSLAPRDDTSPGTPNAHAADHTDERSAINDIVTELGTDPSGTDASVTARLTAVDVWVHNQALAAAVWTIDHNKGRIPSGLYVRESTGDELDPIRTDPTVNQTVLDFDGMAVSGTAYLG